MSAIARVAGRVLTAARALIVLLATTARALVIDVSLRVRVFLRRADHAEQ